MELVTGRPQDKRIDKEERVYDLLDQLNIDDVEELLQYIKALIIKKQIPWKCV